MSLTSRQSEVLELIRCYIEEEGFPPTRVEIADIMGFSSPNAAHDHVRALERKGHIEVVPAVSRGIRLK
jgi:repressor LexA